MGTVNCQYCGTPLMDTGSGGGVNPNMVPGSGMPSRGGAPDQRQAELPAWLESLRSSERPVPSPMGTSGPSGFTPPDLVDEGMLPAWMRPDRTEPADANPSGAYPT